MFLAGSAGAATLTVDDSGGANYSRIQDAIDNASAGDTILVYSGTYYENVDVNNELILRGFDNGSGKPVVNADRRCVNGRCSAINLSAGNSTLEGFIATGSSGGSPDTGGIVLNSNNNIISNNTAWQNSVGIFVYSSKNNTLNGNTVQKNTHGIELHVSSNNTLSKNTASYNDCGICFEQSSNNTLSNNTANSNKIYIGIFLFESDNNTLTNNTANLNNYGIGLDRSRNNRLRNNTALFNNFSIGLSRYSNNNIISGNNISDNVNYGIWLNSSRNNTLSGNIANSNLNSGIYLDSSSSNTLSKNTIINNGGYGIVFFDSSNNLIYDNFFNNTNNFVIWKVKNNWNITKIPGANIISGSYIGGNVWANPSGIGFSQTCADSDSDGICDSPYTLYPNNTDYLPLVYQPTGPDITKPSLTFTAQTPANGSILGEKWVVVSIVSNEFLRTSLLEWNGINESMSGSGTSWNKRKISLANGTHSFKVWGSDHSGNWNSTEARVITIAAPPSDRTIGGGSGNGSVASGPMTWTASNFPAFWHEDGISGEMLAVLQPDLSSSQRIISKMNLVYNLTLTDK